MLAILGFQPIYKVCIENYLVPTSRMVGGKEEDDNRGSKAIMSKRMMHLPPFSVLLFLLSLPLLALSFFPSPSPLSSFLSSVCHLYSGETWRPRAPVKYNCQYMCVYRHTCLLACLRSGNMLSLNQICISNLSAGLLHWPGALLYLHIEL